MKGNGRLHQRTIEKARVQSVATSPGKCNVQSAHALIERRAYELYVASGFQEGRDVEFWLEAERELETVS